MLTFDPPSLHADLAKAFSALKKHIGLGISEFTDDIPDVAESFDPSQHDDRVIDSATRICLRLPYCDEYLDTTCGEIGAFLEEISRAELQDLQCCWTPQRALFRVVPNLLLETMADNLRVLESARYPDGALKIEGKSKSGVALEASVVRGTTPFAFLIVKADKYDKFFPPVSSEEWFVQIVWSGKVDRAEVNDMLAAYLFELDVSARLVLVPEPRPSVLAGRDYEEEQSETPSGARLRPLLSGLGLNEMISTFNAASRTVDTPHQILSFVKVLEFVSPTILRSQMIDSVTAKLSSPRALSPDAAFVLELEALVNESKANRKDREAMKLTVAACCDAFELAPLAAPCLKLLKAVGHQSDEKARRAALEEFAGVIMATRNWIAHAKANYATTGEECPPNQLWQLAECLRSAAQQAIRYFARLPAERRVI